ncbi:MAG: hypothetical protein FWB93_00470 [Oscillospiraceae bacterium]|nr:hypothetical protein [Oscillospiraceae bacterium]
MSTTKRKLAISLALLILFSALSVVFLSGCRREDAFTTPMVTRRHFLRDDGTVWRFQGGLRLSKIENVYNIVHIATFYGGPAIGFFALKEDGTVWACA